MCWVVEETDLASNLKQKILEDLEFRGQHSDCWEGCSCYCSVMRGLMPHQEEAPECQGHCELSHGGSLILDPRPLTALFQVYYKAALGCWKDSCPLVAPLVHPDCSSFHH